MSNALKEFDPSLAFAGMEDVLPVCPCGCGGRRAEFYRVGKECKRPAYLEEYLVKHFNKDLRYEITSDEWAEVEAKIIREKDWQVSPLAHVMTHIKIMAPWVTHDPNLVRLFRESLWCEEHGVRRISMMGHASSGKTHFIIVEVFQLNHIFKDNCQAFFASPYKNASDYLLWSDLTAFAHRLKKESKMKFFDKTEVRNNWVQTGEHSSGSGSIRLVSFHKEGVIRGKKQGGDYKTEARLLVNLDEAGEFPNKSILKALSNLRSQPGLRVRTGTNFRDAFGLDGEFHEPARGTYLDLDREKDMRWKTTGNGLSIRFRAKSSGNVYSETDYYPYLLQQKEHEELLSYGADSPDYLAMGDAFPSIESVSKTLIFQSDIDAGRAFEKETLQNRELFAFLDPSFTYGGDSAVLLIFEYGYSAADDKNKVSCLSRFEIEIPYSPLWTEELLGLAKKYRRAELPPNCVEGEKIDTKILCSLRAGEILEREKVPFNNFGYDESMRGTLSHWMQFFLGEGPTPYEYGGKPDNRPAFPPKKKWTKTSTGRRHQVPKMNDECHIKMVSQMWMSAVNLVKNGYICNGEKHFQAFQELKKRIKDAKSGQRGKEDVESKAEYKDRNQNKSPDDADAFCGGLNMIIERRFSPQVNSSDHSLRGDMAVLEMLYEEDGPRRRNMIPTLGR